MVKDELRKLDNSEIEKQPDVKSAMRAIEYEGKVFNFFNEIDGNRERRLLDSVESHGVAQLY